MPCIWTRCSGPLTEKQAHNIKDPAVYLTVDMGYFFIPVCTKLIWWGCCQKAHLLVSSDHRRQCHLKIQSCLITEYAGLCFWMSWDHFSWNTPKQHVVMLDNFLKVFWPRDSAIFCCVLQSLWPSHSPPHRALGRYRHTSSYRQIFNIFTWLELLNHYPDGGN